MKVSDHGSKGTDWPSIYVATGLTFITAVQFSIFVASLWPFLQIVDATATETFFGVIISIYSLGQILASPLVGYWSNKVRSSVGPLYMGLVLMLVGNLVYLFIPIIPIPGKKYIFLVSRVITGVGSANSSLLKAYAATASTGRDRSKAISYVTGGLALGSTVGYGTQLLFTPLGATGLKISSNFGINIYTAPALYAALLNVLGIFLVKKYFIENDVGIVKKADREKHGDLPPFDKLALLVCYMIRFMQKFVSANIESLGTPLAMTMFAWNRETVIRNLGIVQTVQATVHLIVYLGYIKFNLGRKFNSRQVLYASISGLLLFHLVTYSWPFLPGTMVTYNNEDVKLANGTELVGCNTDNFDWCLDISPINAIVFYTACVVFIGMCTPNINITLNTLFSKIIGPRPQAAQQGWLQVSAGAGRFVGPVIVSYLYTQFGPRWVWNAVLLIVAATLALCVVFRRRMVPLTVPDVFAEFQDQDDPDLKRRNKAKLNKC
uniref:MFS domain-containing protein n=1 Tax=Panagrellus redivivus TaxID=6233 RepID=A0A7E4W2E2_PANRE